MSSSRLRETSSFSTTKINSSTFVIREDDAFNEHPLIYVKKHPNAPTIIISDTGCDAPSAEAEHARFVRLREYLEHCPVSCNDDEPLNPGGARQYTIICTHCHYDHIGGISQFLLGGTTDIIASAAGRDFIESDLEENGLFRYVDKVTPWYQVTHWAQAFEKLVFPVPRRGEKSTNASKLEVIDLAITLIQQPGHTPDSLAWYDHDEMHLYVGDSVYEEGEEEMRIIWPPQGNMIEWTFSMQKLRQFVRSENAQALVRSEELDEPENWEVVPRRVKLGAGHQTHSADAEECLEQLEKLWWKTLRGEIPVVAKEYLFEDAYFTWREPGWGMSFKGPARLMDDAVDFFKAFPSMAEDLQIS